MQVLSYSARPGLGQLPNVVSQLPNVVSQLATIERQSLWIGVGLGAVGTIAGGFIGRWAGGHRPLVTVGSAVGGGLGVGFGSYFLVRRMRAAKAAQSLVSPAAY